MVGRGAQGGPWIFREIKPTTSGHRHRAAPPTRTELKTWMLAHLHEHYDLYGEYTGVRSARKHLGWYAQAFGAGELGNAPFAAINGVTSCEAQLRGRDRFFDVGERRNGCRIRGPHTVP